MRAETAAQEVTLPNLSVVQVSLPHAQINTLARHGSDLDITTGDEQTIIVHGFCADGRDGDNDLVLQDGALVQVTGLPDQGMSINLYPSIAANGDADVSTGASVHVDTDADLMIDPQSDDDPVEPATSLGLSWLSLGVGLGAASPRIGALTANFGGTLPVSGKAMPGHTVTEIFPDGGNGSAIAGGNGGYIASLVPQQAGEVTVSATDPEGNTSPATGIGYVTESNAPAVPGIGLIVANGSFAITGVGVVVLGKSVTFFKKWLAPSEQAGVGNDWGLICREDRQPRRGELLHQGICRINCATGAPHHPPRPSLRQRCQSFAGLFVGKRGVRIAPSCFFKKNATTNVKDVDHRTVRFLSILFNTLGTPFSVAQCLTTCYSALDSRPQPSLWMRAQFFLNSLSLHSDSTTSARLPTRAACLFYRRCVSIAPAP